MHVYLNAVIFSSAGQTTEFALEPMGGFRADVDRTQSNLAGQNCAIKETRGHFGCHSRMWRHHYYYYYYVEVMFAHS